MWSAARKGMQCLGLSAVVLLVAFTLFSGYSGLMNHNQLDRFANQLRTTGHMRMAWACSWYSANLLHSHTAEIAMGDALTDTGNTQAAWDYYFPAVFTVHRLGLDAGKRTLRHANSDQAVGMAASYLMWAADDGNAEAERLLGNLTVGFVSQASCKRWKRALPHFQKAAQLGDSYAQLVVASAAGAGFGMAMNDKLQAAYLLLAERTDNPAASKLTTYRQSACSDVMGYQCG